MADKETRPPIDWRRDEDPLGIEMTMPEEQKDPQGDVQVLPADAIKMWKPTIPDSDNPKKASYGGES